MLEYEVYELLQKYGIKTPRYEVYDNYTPMFFEHFPAVLKIASPKVVHKSDVGGVRTGIHSNEELELARQEMIAELQKNGIFLDNKDRFIVEEEIEGEEFYIGGIYDAIFDEVLLFGKGGTLLEVEKDICYIDTHAGSQEILRSFKRTKISKIFPKFRGKNYKIEYVVDAVQKFQKFFCSEAIAEFDVNPLIYTDEGFVAVDARLKPGKKHRKSYTPKKGLFENESVAIFGATDKPQKVGYAIAKNALASKAKVYFVNPRLDTLFGQKVYHDLDELPPIDTAVIAVPSKHVLDLVERLAKRGVKNIVVISAGFKEAGNKEAENRLKELADRFSLNLVGPNCLGIYNGDKELNLTFAADTIRAGSLGLVSQSGAVLSALVDKAATYSIGFSHIISLGNMADYNFANAIEELEAQPSCKSIAIYAEGVQNGKAFLEAIRQSTKPIYLYKAGKTEAAKKAAFSHTGNISGSYEMMVGLAHAAGASVKNDIDSLIFSQPFAKKPIIILTNAGGPGTILADIVSQHGHKLYELTQADIEALSAVLPSTWSHNNPIDIIGDATSERYKAALEVLKNKSALILAIVTPQFMTDSLNIAKIFLAYENVVPIFFGSEAFKEVFAFYKERKVLYFDDLENVANIL